MFTQAISQLGFARLTLSQTNASLVKQLINLRDAVPKLLDLAVIVGAEFLDLLFVAGFDLRNKLVVKLLDLRNPFWNEGI